MEVAEALLEFPAAPPDVYLRWVAFWREVEQIMLARPALEAYASESSGVPFLRGDVSTFITTRFARAIVDQATEARERGEWSVRPVISSEPGLLHDAAEYVYRRGEWLDAGGVLAAIGVTPLAPDIQALREQVFRTLHTFLGLDADEAHGPNPAAQAS